MSPRHTPTRKVGARMEVDVVRVGCLYTCTALLRLLSCYLFYPHVTRPRGVANVRRSVALRGGGRADVVDSSTVDTHEACRVRPTLVGGGSERTDCWTSAFCRVTDTVRPMGVPCPLRAGRGVVDQEGRLLRHRNVRQQGAEARVPDGRGARGRARLRGHLWRCVLPRWIAADG